MEIYKDFRREDLDGEKWKGVNGFPRYLVSNMGRVKNLNGDIIKAVLNRGYPLIGVTRVVNGVKERKAVRVHRLVADVFVSGRTPDKCTVNHKDNIKTNNNAKNLEWLSLRDNKRESYKLGHNKFKNTPDDIRNIRRLSKAGLKQMDIAIEIGINQSTVSAILSGKQWSYIK